MSKPDNHIDEFKEKLMQFWRDSHLPQTESFRPKLWPDEFAEQIMPLIDQYYADFYRNKILEARKDELNSLKQHDKYPFYSDEAEQYVINRLNELGNTQ